MDYPQNYDTHCLICGKKFFAPVKDFICNTCHDSEVSTVVDFIVKQNARIAKLEKIIRVALDYLYNTDDEFGHPLEIFKKIEAGLYDAKEEK